MAAIQNISDLIQLAIAPVFLLSAVATTLVVFINRLARIVDRGRFLEENADPKNKGAHEELLVLERRAQMIYRALMFGVLSALAVCMLMSLAFAGEVLKINTARAVSWMFVTALFMYTAALLCLLREVFLAINNFRLGIHTVSPGK